jgi:hypothetical protein
MPLITTAKQTLPNVSQGREELQTRTTEMANEV